MSGLPPEQPSQTFDSLYGLQILDATPDLLRAEVAVSDRVKQPYGLTHGGVFASMAESLSSLGTMLAVSDSGKVAVGMSNHTTFLRPVSDGTIHAQARPRHRGRTTWVWDVEITDDDERLCAMSRVTIAVR